MNAGRELVREFAAELAVQGNQQVVERLTRALADPSDLDHAVELAESLVANLDRAYDYLLHGRGAEYVDSTERHAALRRRELAVRVLRELAPEPSPAPRGDEAGHEAASARPVVRPVAVANRLVDVLARLLPVAHRARYHEELRGELYDLAALGASRWRQLGYALRQLDRAWVLRAELRAPAVGRTRFRR